MAANCCYGCVKPKRYPGCHDHCPDYAAEKAESEKSQGGQDDGQICSFRYYQPKDRWCPASYEKAWEEVETMYKSPIEVFMTDIQHQIEQQKDEEIYKAVVSVGINVDKEELIRALRYDRQQYNAGFLAGMAVAKPEWIPVTERLPEVVDSYLVVVKYKYDYEKEYSYDTDVATYNPYEKAYIDDCWNTYSDWDEGQQYIHVTHWMPLPEPPKEV